MNKLFYCLVGFITLIVLSFVFVSVSSDKRILQILEQNTEAMSQMENNVYVYPHLEGKPVFCRMYVYVNVDTGVQVSLEEEDASLEGNVKWEKRVESGLKDKCPNRGNGCNPYSCQSVPYPNLP